MVQKLFRLAVLLAMALSAVTGVVADEVPIGTQIEDLAFKDIRYLPRSLTDFGDKKAFVLAFTNTICPLVQRYLPVLDQLDERYGPKGVQVVAINVGPGDSIKEMAAQAVRHDLAFPFVKDPTGDCARALGITRTPEVVVLDGDRRIRYRGRIDDQYRLGGVRPTVTRHDLDEAIGDVLADRAVRIPSTQVDGCLITFPTEAKAGEPVSYAEQVAPILQKHCVDCHHPGTEAPFSLLGYSDAVEQAEMIGEVVADERMPPWFASDDIGHFANQRGMSAAERELVARWIRQGTPKGDRAATPIAVEGENTDGWLIGEPDLVVGMTKDDTIAAHGYVPYQYRLLPMVFKHDTWVERVQILPSNGKVVHHANLAYVKPGEKFSEENFITGKVPGGIPMMLDAGVAVKIPKGSMLGLQVHYTTTGTEEKCRLAVGLRFPRAIVRKEIHNFQINDQRFAIPPGAPHHRVVGQRTFRAPATGVGLFSHMHLRGKDMTFTAHYPDGERETLLEVPNYSFDWQIGYQWPPGTRKFPKGTTIEVVAHFDNSAFNPYNPDPTATVRFGPQTYHEMMYGFFFFTYDDEDLNLAIDPKTGKGRPASDVAAKE